MSFATKEAERVYNTRYVREWRARHRAAGICPRCTQPAVKGSVLCAFHKEWTSDYEKKTRKKRVRSKKR
jgi:hypothetical protein